ncbi:MAG: lytic transglycosylase domain-containing protein [Candidatus Cohnella colombiensis]|uniref:Lytic transglycosylase domain-containing protein n=1 Tax=Candidatus Cohnella colombiensis TaxID=3121368 RepID=A0AA95EU76_9BACL|nr:MAG: lytic transglycosylase domain-containing protein [Cohnella sp.]
MNVSTDPRIVKQMLLAQWSSGVNPLASSTTDSSDATGTTVFDMLLQQYMNSNEQNASSGSSSLNSLLSLEAIGHMSTSSVWSGQLANSSGSFSAYDELILAAGNKYGVEPALIKGVIQSESSFNANAVSSAGAKGLMQLMDGTARGLGVSNSFDPEQNIDGGTRFLSYLLRKYDGNIGVALAAYNAGPGRIDRLGITNDQDLAAAYEQLPQETQNYISKVLGATQNWRIAG